MKDANYRTEENPDSVAKVDNNHTYTYDANGNLVYVNTGRIKQDGTLERPDILELLDGLSNAVYAFMLLVKAGDMGLGAIQAARG